MINVVYFTDDVRCYKNGRVERKWRSGIWREVKNTANCKYGYNLIGINYKKILRHRIIGYCFLNLDIYNPREQIDHINHDKLDNSVDNLRACTTAGNQQNQQNAKGYYWIENRNKWRAQIRLNGKDIFGGYYVKEEDAIRARELLKEKHHTYFKT